MSINTKLIEDFLESKNVKYVSSCSFIEDEGTLILNIPISFLASGATTPRKIKNLKNSISEKFNTQVIESITQSEKSNTIHFGITSIINEEISADAYDLSLIIQSDGNLNTHLKFKTQIQSGKITKIEEKIKKYFLLLEAEKFSIDIIKNSENPPTLTAILRSAKKLAPFLMKDIIKELESRNFDLPSEKWMNNQLDSIRKKGLIFRRSDEKYTLTYKGILATPSAGNRNSSDIERVLYMARKKW